MLCQENTYTRNFKFLWDITEGTLARDAQYTLCYRIFKIQTSITTKGNIKPTKPNVYIKISQSVVFRKAQGP